MASTIDRLVKRRDALLSEYHDVCRKIRAERGIKERPKEGQVVRAELKDSNYTKGIGTVIGIYRTRHPEGFPSVGRGIKLANGDVYKWERVTSWQPESMIQSN